MLYQRRNFTLRCLRPALKTRVRIYPGSNSVWCQLVKLIHLQSSLILCLILYNVKHFSTLREMKQEKSFLSPRVEGIEDALKLHWRWWTQFLRKVIWIKFTNISNHLKQIYSIFIVRISCRVCVGVLRQILGPTG